MENWERSGSESEGGEADVRDPRPALGTSQSSSASPPSSTSSPISAPSVSTSNYTTAPSTPSSSSSVDQEDPSPVDHAWGARAWEEIDTSAGAITVKRVPEAEKARHFSAPTADKQAEGEDVAKSVVGWEDDDSFEGRRLDPPPFTVKRVPTSASESAGERLRNGKKASVRLGLGRGGKGGVNGRGEKRVITAIFSAEPESQHESVSEVVEKDAQVSLGDVPQSEIVCSSLESVQEPSHPRDDDHSAEVDFDGAMIETETNGEADRALARAQALAAAEAEGEKQADARIPGATWYSVM